MRKLIPKQLTDLAKHKILPIGKRLFMRLLSKDIVDMVRLQMLYNIGNGWSFYAYKKLGPEGIIEVELEMWDNILPPAVEKLVSVVDLEGNSIEKAKQFLNFMYQINGYRPKYIDQTPTSLLWEYTICPNWDSIAEMQLDDYYAKDGQPAAVSCIHGCTRVHEIYFANVDPRIRVQSLKNRPQAEDTCSFRITVDG